jgi:hypothetical protein
MAEFAARRVAVFVRLLMVGWRRIDGLVMVMKHTGGDRRLSVIKQMCASRGGWHGDAQCAAHERHQAEDIAYRRHDRGDTKYHHRAQLVW